MKFETENLQALIRQINIVQCDNRVFIHPNKREVYENMLVGS